MPLQPFLRRVSWSFTSIAVFWYAAFYWLSLGSIPSPFSINVPRLGDVDQSSHFASILWHPSAPSFFAITLYSMLNVPHSALCISKSSLWNAVTWSAWSLCLLELCVPSGVGLVTGYVVAKWPFLFFWGIWKFCTFSHSVSSRGLYLRSFILILPFVSLNLARSKMVFANPSAWRDFISKYCVAI